MAATEQTLSLAYSTCPNDTFMFEALINRRVDTEGLSFDVSTADIKELNELARAVTPDVCKVSYFAYARLREDYALLRAGSALGVGCGPLLVSKRPLLREELAEANVGIPGVDTTAHLLLQYYAPEVRKKEVLLFSEIMPAVADGRLDAGVIIHESRFVYPNFGLQLAADLGEYWETQTGLPIPLGGIVARKALGELTVAKLDRALRRSIAFAFENPEVVMPYVRSLAQELEPDVMRAHIDLYVNDYSLDYGPQGDKAIAKLLETAQTLAG